MKFVYTNSDHTQIQGTLDEGESFGYHTGPTTFSIGMAPGNRDWDELFPNAVVETDPVSNTAVAKDPGAPAHPVDDFVAPPPPPVAIAKVDLYRKLTDAEYTSLLQGLGQQSARMQGIFNAAINFRSDAEEWTLLQTMATQLYGADRAKQLLDPEYYRT